MVNIPQYEAPPAVRDEKALEIFQHQWELYRKVLDNDYMSSYEAYAELNRFLTGVISRPFNFVDLACGDASGIVPALEGTRIVSYHGIDLAAPALALAAKNIKPLSCPAELEQADFVTAMETRSGPVDIVWISMSLHHLETPGKRALMRAIRGRMDDSGAFLIYEPTRGDGEDRSAYLDRFEETGRKNWTALSGDEFEDAMTHVRTCDLPETASEWVALGREAGFSRIAELYRSPDDLFRLFSYRA